MINAALFLMVVMQLPFLEGAECQKDFINIDKFCYALKKEPEQFADRFDHCPGNLFTYDLYNNLSLPNPERFSLWTDYKTLYPGGLLGDMSHTSSMGTILNTTTHKVSLGKNVSVDDELCVLHSYGINLSMVGCGERHYRYCVVEADLEPHDFARVNLTLTIDG